MPLCYLTTTCPGVLGYHGQRYDLLPITPPEVDLHNILVISGLPLARSICEENPPLQHISFAAERLPGFPRRLAEPVQDLAPGTRLWLLRGGGIGDVIMLEPALRALRERLRPGVAVTLCTFADLFCLFAEREVVDRLVPQPVRMDDFLNCDVYAEFDDPHKLFNKIEMIDFHLDCLGIDPATIPAGEKIPRLSPTLSRSPRILRLLADLEAHRQVTVLFSHTASDRIRHIPPGYAACLAAAHPEILFLVPGALPPELSERENVRSLDTSGGLSDFVTAIACCDALVSADSSACHIAAAVDTPALVLFGPIDSRMRTGYYPRVLSLDADYRGETCLSPCGISALTETPPVIPIAREQVRLLKKGLTLTTRSGRSFTFDPARGCPEANALDTPFSPCLASFDEQALLTVFEQLLQTAFRESVSHGGRTDP